jgi:cholesterol oxidase
MADSDRHASLSFSEIMKGYIGMGETEILTGYSKAVLAGTYIETILKVTAENLTKFLNEPDHAAVPAGILRWPAMGGDLPIQGGEFQLFVATGNNLAKRLNYQLFVTGPQGPLTISGFKTLTDNPTAGIWFDTSTLWTRIFPGHISIKESATATPVGAGIINLYKFDFLKVVFSFRVKGPGSFGGRLRFLEFFFGTIIKFWFAKFFGRRQ